MKNRKTVFMVCGAGLLVLLCIVAVILYNAFGTSKTDGTKKSLGEASAVQNTKKELTAEDIPFEAQYIRTSWNHSTEFEYPVAVIRSAAEIQKYYDDNKNDFNLERRENPSSESTIGFLDACDKYDDKFFEDKSLVVASIFSPTYYREYEIENIKLESDGAFCVNIKSTSPETDDEAIAYWHIITEIPKDKAPKSTENITVYLNGVKVSRHSHSTATEEQTVDEPFVGYCGNTQTTIYFHNGESYTFMSGNSVVVTDMLLNLRYDKNKLCKCLPEYTIDTEFGLGYGVNLSEGYARCDKGQADLTEEQVAKLEEIILWAKEEASVDTVNGKYPKYSFSFTWGTYGISSYDSESGILIKTTDATNPEDYKTNHKLTEKEYSAIWKLIKGLDIESYPDNYNPHEDGSSCPYMTVVLSVKADGIDKTITVKETVLSYETNNEKGQKFLDVCEGIKDILTGTDEWKALPEYEILYD